MSNFKLVIPDDKKFVLSSEQVIEALANYLADMEMIGLNESQGTMRYYMNNDAGMTVELSFNPSTTVQ
jgi:hypothetical protein